MLGAAGVMSVAGGLASVARPRSPCKALGVENSGVVLKLWPY